MKNTITGVLIGVILGLSIAGYLWLHFRVRDLENWRINLVLNAQRQIQQAQQRQ